MWCQNRDGPVSDFDFSIDLACLPPVNSSCWTPSPVAPGKNVCCEVCLPNEYREVDTFDSDCETFVRENNNYSTFYRTIVTNVNRNHLHRQRVITNENQFNTYVTNNVTRVNDIHHQQLENVCGESRVFNKYHDNRIIEPPRCLRQSNVYSC